MRDFRKMQVWQKAHQLTLLVYRITRTYPPEELFGLTSQTRRAAASIPANIAEGCGRESAADFRRFLAMAMGSASELEYHLLLARDLGLLHDSDDRGANRDVVEVKRMLASLILKLRADTHEGAVVGRAV